MKIKSVLLPTLALLLICLVVTAALSITNHYTKDAIEAQNQKKVTDTMELLIPGATFTAQNETTYLAQKEGQVYYVFITKAMGYKSKVEVMTSLTQTGQIHGVSVINCSEESPGIGQKVGTDNKFLSQFDGLSHKVESIDAITGATYSSVAVKDAVNMALSLFSAMNTPTPTNVGGAQ